MTKHEIQLAVIQNWQLNSNEIADKLGVKSYVINRAKKALNISPQIKPNDCVGGTIRNSYESYITTC